MNLILYFFIYSVIGFLIETVYTFILEKRYSVRRSMLQSPMCIVYGMGAVALIVVGIAEWNNIFAIFTAGFFVCSAVEYGVSLLYEKICGVVLWDYSGIKGNLRGRICVRYSVYWGIVTVFFCKAVHPATEFLVGGIDLRIKIVSVVTLLIYFRKDLILTLNEMKKLGNGEKSLCETTLEYISPAPKRKIY